MTKTPSRKPPSFTLTLPATSANLGPAFDAAALAFSLYLTVRAKPAAEFSITARGRDSEICARMENHLILTTYREVLEAEHRSLQPLSLQLNNEIPIGKGCGSSAAARLAGIALANHFGRLRWTDAHIIGEASRREHHPDNAAACWRGGLAVARMTSDGEAHVAQVTPKGKWPLLLALPEESLSTEKARQVLPDKYSRADVVANIQNSMLLLAAFSQGRRDLLSAALDDRIHQPYRAGMCPLLPCLQPLSASSGILGVVLSGAGPAVLVFLDPKSNQVKATRKIQDQLKRSGLAAELLTTEIVSKGAAGSRRS